MADTKGANGTRETFRVVGQPNIPGKLSYALATGIAKFGIDYAVDGMLHAKFLRSPYANARVKSVDAAAAWAMDGVVDIVRWDDDDIQSLPKQGGARPFLDSLADSEGAEVGLIVVAESEDICEAALRSLEIEWEVLPHVVDVLKGAQEGAPAIRPWVQEAPTFGAPNPAITHAPKRGNVSYSTMVSGDVQEGMAQADYIEGFEMYLPAFAASLPNPSGSVAWWFEDPYNGPEKSLHIEGAVRERRQIANLYKLPLEKTVQEGLFMGGKYCDWGLRKSQQITPLLAKRAGRPVRCVNTREETFDFMMMERYMHVKVGYTKGGLITAMDDHSICDGGVWGSSSFGNVGDLTQGPYNSIKCKNIRQQMEVVDSNRGIMTVSGQHCPFNWDNMTMAIYLISEKLGMDPMDVAAINLHGPDSKDDPDPVPSFEACVAAAKEQWGWQWHKSGEKMLPDGRMHGASFRYQMCPRHSVSGYTCKLEYRNGKVHLPTQGPLFGVYAVEVNAMVVAEELGLAYDDVVIDFDYREAFTPVGGGSDGTTASAWAMKECANILKERILEACAQEANNPPPPSRYGPPPEVIPFAGHTADELEMDGGKVFLKSDPSVSIAFEKATKQNVFATYQGQPPLAMWAYGMGLKLDTMNVAGCEVAVDTETGEVEILKWVVAADPGKIIRRTSLESQIDQVMFFSGGCQLSEEYIYDKATGVMLDRNMFEYKKPTILDFAPVHKELLETRVGNAAYGSNGISHSLANTHLAVCAIQNAIGKWVDPPATPDKILKALGKA